MLRPDALLPHRDLMSSDDLVTEFLNDKIAPAFLKGEELRSAALRYLAYRPGRRCVGLYDLEVAGHTAPIQAVVSLVKDETFRQIRHHYADLPEQGALFIEDCRCLVEFFPSDWELPSLPGAADSHSALALLAEAGLDWRSGEDLTASVLSYRPRENCVLVYGSGDEGSFRLVGKAVQSATEPDRMQRTSEFVNTKLRDSKLRMPKVYVPRSAQNLFFMDYVTGSPLPLALSRAASLEERNRLMRRAAQALLDLHRAHNEEQAGPFQTLETRLEHARGRAARLETVAPELALRANRVLDALAGLPAVDGVPQTLVHGDFKAINLHLEGELVWMIDFGKSCQGDPAIDASNFVADLHRKAALTGEAEPRRLAKAFLEEYVSHSPWQGIGRRTALLSAIELVKKAVGAFQHDPFSYRESESSPPVRLLEEAERCLAAL